MAECDNSWMEEYRKAEDENRLPEWLAEQGIDIDQFDLADEAAQEEIDSARTMRDDEPKA